MHEHYDGAKNFTRLLSEHKKFLSNIVGVDEPGVNESTLINGFPFLAAIFGGLCV